MRSKKAIKNILFSLFLQITNVLCGFIIPKLIMKNFGSDINGLVSSITQFLGYIVLLEAGVGPVIKSLLYKPISENDNYKIASILSAAQRFFRTISLIFLIYIIILAFVFPNIVDKSFDHWYTISLLFIISMSTFAEYYFGMTYRLYISAKQETYVISLIQIITTIINTILVIILVRINCSIHFVKFVSASIFIFRPIMQNIYVKRKYNFRLSNGDKNYKIINKWDGFAQHIAAVVHNNTDITILTIFSTLPEVSVYSVYYLVVNGVKNLVSSLTGGIDASFGDMIAKKEINNLNIKFRYYELFYFTVTTIVYACAFILIVPFVKIYTNGITDVNYVRPLFGFLIVMAEYVVTLRLPYISITYAAGHFKETMIGAWVESIVNIIVSVFLVYRIGLVGVAIGTLISIFIRLIEFVIHSSKIILNRKPSEAFKRLFISFVEIFIIKFIVDAIFKYIKINSYYMFICGGIISLMISSMVTIFVNFLFYKADFLGISEMIKRIKRKD